MAKPNPLRFLLIFSFLSLLLPSTSIPDAELEAAIYSLRSRGYHLFGNAITASDLRFDLLLSNASFTLFAATDAALFSLDMSSAATAYVAVLRVHVALGRLPLPTLRALSPGTALPTLLPSREIIFSHRDSVDTITVDGVDVAFPGVFYGENLAVHGLAGILTELQVHPSESPAPAIRSPDSRHPHAISRGFCSDCLFGISEPKNHRVPNGAPSVDHQPSESPAPAFRYPDSRHPYANTLDFSSDWPSGSAEPKNQRVPNGAPAMDLQSSESPAPAFRSVRSHHRHPNSPDFHSDWPSGSAEPEDRGVSVGAPAVGLSRMGTHSHAPRANPWRAAAGGEIPMAERGAPEVSLAAIRACGSSGSLTSSEMVPFADEIPESSRIVAPLAAFSWDDGTFWDSEGLWCAPARETADKRGPANGEHSSNQRQRL